MAPATAPGAAAQPGAAFGSPRAAPPATRPGASGALAPLAPDTAAQQNRAQARPNQGEAPADSAAQAAPVRVAPADETAFQRFVLQTTGTALPLYGYELFSRGAFTATQGVSVPASYVLGPGDEVIVQVYDAVDLTATLQIDRNGRVMVPRAGPLTLAGVRFGDAERVLKAHLSRVFRNFGLTVTMGQLRSTEVFVVGHARNPGKHLVSGLSTLINGLFETGGPSTNGSLRHIELRRGGRIVARVDLYQFLARGDDSGDERLQPGDVIVIPATGPRAAVLGSVNAPAIYELKPGETIQQVLALSGGLPVLAAPQKAQLERINPRRTVARYVEDFSLDDAGLARPLQAGDVLTIFQISPQIADVVTLQGNVAAPMRYVWRPGMRVSDLLADPKQLIPSAYWLQQNAGALTTSPSRPEVNLDYATVQRLDAATLRTQVLPFNPRKALGREPTEDLMLASGDIVTIYRPGDPGPDTNQSVTVNGSIVGGVQRFVWRPGFTVRDIIPNAEWLVDYYSYWQQRSGQELRNDINWDYAQIVRRVPQTLQTRTLNFNLGGAVLQGNLADNVVLEPGDQITLYTTAELPVPTARRTRLVTLNGEVKVPGTYQLAPGETLAQVLQRAGGLTPQAYAFGLDFRRESTRISQQQNLDRIIQRLEVQAQSDIQTKLQNVSSPEQQATAQLSVAADRQRLDALKNLRATGRISLRLDPERAAASLPEIVLEDGDAITVPQRPAFVAAFGAVNNENVVLWKPGMTVGDLLDLAGVTPVADVADTHVLRADGTVLDDGRASSGNVFRWTSNIRQQRLQPGDTVVVPERADRETPYTRFIRGAKDITTVFYQFGLGAAAIKTLRD